MQRLDREVSITSPRKATVMTGLDLSPQLQAGLGRPANYKKEAVVAAALGLRDLGRRTIYKKEQW